MGLVSQLDHAAYLVRELARAEMSLDSDIKYVQDKAQGEIQSQAEIID
jgi:tetrahydromethanopterin S-methyltransferase subunit A